MGSPKKQHALASKSHEWAKTRRFVFRIITHSACDMIVSCIILSNILVMIYETDKRASGDDMPGWIDVIGTFYLIFYIIELSVRLYVFRCHFFTNSMNLFDFVIVGMDCAFALLDPVIGKMPNVTMFRILRVMRALRFVRAVRTLVFFRELYVIMNGFFSAMKAIVWATVLLTAVLMLWAVVAVEAIHPIVVDLVSQEESPFDDSRAPRAFSSVMQAMLTFTGQIVASDAWGDVTIPIIEAEPWTIIIFGAVLVTVNLGLMNLILSVIVGKAQQARAEDVAFRLQEKEEEFVKTKKNLMRLCEELDEDGSRTMTLNELLDGFDTNNEFRFEMASMDVERDDISNLFSILDEDDSGEVSYDEFIDQLYKTKTQDTHVVLVFIRGHVKEINSQMKTQEDQLSTLESRLDSYEGHSAEILRLVTNMAEKRMKQKGESLIEDSTQQSDVAATNSAEGDPNSTEAHQPTQTSDIVSEDVNSLKEQIAQMNAMLRQVAASSQPDQTVSKPLQNLMQGQLLLE
jgi:Ca2+-binding EF-hand superfamily protein